MTKKKTTLATISFALFALAIAFPAWASYPKVNLGTYVFSGGAKQQKALEKAIHKISSKVNFFVRGRVHNGLKKVFAIKQKLTIKMNGKTIVIQAGGGKPLASKLGGQPSAFRGKKGVVLLSRSFSGSTLTERYQPKGKKGNRTHQYTFSKDGKKIVLLTVAYLAKLKKTLRYTLTYTKR